MGTAAAEIRRFIPGAFPSHLLCLHLGIKDTGQPPTVGRKDRQTKEGNTDERRHDSLLGSLIIIVVVVVVVACVKDACNTRTKTDKEPDNRQSFKQTIVRADE